MTRKGKDLPRHFVCPAVSAKDSGECPLQIGAEAFPRHAARSAVNEFACRVQIQAKRQRTRVRHILAPDGHNLRFGMIAIGSETNEMFVEQRADFGLRDDALDEDTAMPSELPPEFDEDTFAAALGCGQRVGQPRVPMHCAPVVEMRMSTHCCKLLESGFGERNVAHAVVRTPLDARLGFVRS